MWKGNNLRPAHLAQGGPPLTLSCAFPLEEAENRPCACAPAPRLGQAARGRCNFVLIAAPVWDCMFVMPGSGRVGVCRSSTHPSVVCIGSAKKFISVFPYDGSSGA